MNSQPTVFFNNLTRSRELIEQGKCPISEYWINSDGVVQKKRSWLFRLIRWIQDLCFNKTISNVWSVFQKTIELLEKEQRSLNENEQKSLKFVVKLFDPLQSELNRWLKSDPQRQAFLESRLQTWQENPLLEALLQVYANSRSVNLDMLKKAPESPFEPKEVGDVSELKNHYDEIPWKNEALEPLKLFVESVNTGEFEKNLKEKILGDVNNKEIQANSLDNIKWPTLEKEQPGRKELSDFFLKIKNLLTENLSPTESSWCPIEEYIDFRLNKTLEDLNRAFLNLYSTSKRRDKFHYFVDCVKNRDPFVSGAPKENLDLYYGQIEIYLQKILSKISEQKSSLFSIMKNKPTKKLSRKQIVACLGALADASELCFAAWISESAEQCRILKLDDHPEDSIEKRFLRHAHHLKQKIILEQTNEKQAIHILNGFKCSDEGIAMGLSDPFAFQDPFKHELNLSQKNALKMRLLQEYPKALLKTFEEVVPNTPSIPKRMELFEKERFLVF